MNGGFDQFVEERLRPRLIGASGTLDVDEGLIAELAETGALAAMIGEEYGGRPRGFVRYGEMCRVLGAASASLQSLLTVHGMVCLTLARSGSTRLRAELLPGLADGGRLGAFALTEDGAGSDIRAIETRASVDGSDFVVTGTKRWLSFGRLADVFLTFARNDSGADIALIVLRSDPGVRVTASPMTTGFASAMLADLHLDQARIPVTRMVGKPGFALSRIATRALTLGRLCVANAAVGLAEEALDMMIGHVRNRRQGSTALKDWQLVKGMIADAVVEVEAARLLCERAGRSLDAAEPRSRYHILIAKQGAARAATRTARACAQLFGARGLQQGHPADRLLGDARVMEVIEGNTQLLQALIADHALAFAEAGERVDRMEGGSDAETR